MSDIKSLYLEAVITNRNDSKIAYENAIMDLYNNDPYKYLTKLEYIIKSDIGCEITEKFIDKNGLAISIVDTLIEKCNEVIDKGKKNNKDISKQEKLKKKVEDFQEYYCDLIDMYKYFSIDNPNEDSYIKTYYGKNKKGIQNRLLAHGLIEKFNELAIPDLLITVDKLNNESCNIIYDNIYENYKDNHTLMQWMSEVCRVPSYKDKFYEYSLEKLYNDYHNKKVNKLKEATLMQESVVYIERSSDDIKNIEDLIYLRQYQEVCSDNNYDDKIQQLYEDIKDLEESDEDKNDIDDNIQPEILHVDSNASFNEETWTANSYDAKSGDVPSYLKNNHDVLKYGETESDEDEKKKEKPKEGELKTTLDDFKRPSVDDSDKIEPYDPSSEEISDDSDNELDKDTKDNNPLTPVTSNGSGVNNYYYYSYNNSNNSYSNSHNKTDNHSNHHNNTTANKRDDHSVTTSNNKKDSHNITNTTNTKSDNHSIHHNNQDDIKNESVFIESEKEIINELRYLQRNPVWKEERRIFHRMFNKDINLEGVIKDPEKEIKISIGGISFTFKSELPNEAGKKQTIDKFGLVPTAIHLFNINRRKITENDIGIANSLRKFFRNYNNKISSTTSIGTLAKIFNLKPKNIVFATKGNIVLTFDTNLKEAPVIGVKINPELKSECTSIDKVVLESIDNFLM